MESYAIPLGALIVSMTTLIFVGLGMRRQVMTAIDERASRNESRIDLLERRLAECEQSKAVLQAENYRLMQRLMRLEDQLNGLAKKVNGS